MNNINICATCLSRNRRSFLLEALNISWEGLQFNKGARICWECKALFQRLQLFKQQVIHAQESLKFCSKKTRPASLSKLATCLKTSYDHTYVAVGVVKEESPGPDPKEELDVKPVLPFEEVEVVFAAPSTSVATLSAAVSNPLNKGAGEEAQVDEEGSELDTSSLERQPENDAASSDGDDEQQDYTDWQNLVSNLKNDKESRKKRSSSSHLIKNVSEEEMQQARQRAMQATRYVKAQYKCEACVLEFTVEHNYNKHMVLKHSPEAGKFMCLICKQRFKTENLAHKHYIDHYRFYQCRECDFSHQKLSIVQRHYENNHEAERVFECNQCDEKFLTRRKMKNHVQTVHKAAAKCPVCQKTFSNASNLKIHQRTHADHPRLECSVCHKQYKGEHSLVSHMRTHESPAPPEDAYCAECDVRFKHRFMYLSHLKYSSRHVTEDSYRYQCDECGRKFIMKHYLEEHIEREHLKILQYQCEQCNQKFVSRRQKRRHVYHIHKMNGVVDKRVTCKICGKEFVNSRTCKTHQRVHTGERPYHCQLCPMKFSQNSTLKTHIKGKHKKEAALLC